MDWENVRHGGLVEDPSEITLPVGPALPCPYLPNQEARFRGFQTSVLPPSTYRALLDRGFRRSGRVLYQPACPHCNQCQQLRIDTDLFRTSKSQRRVWNRNQDLEVDVGDPHLTHEKWKLYTAYLRQQHDGIMSEHYEDLMDFLYASPTDTVELTFSLGSELVAVSIADHCDEGLSSVYAFFDPRLARRALGTFSVLWEIEYCRRNHIPYYYLGFYVADCAKMNYKARFKPHQLLDDQYHWNIVQDPRAEVG